ncbi:MAG: fumarylacetoacetate hydrolase family protein, partial [Chloroflexi bacterium]|nr:fumarylacetoacetate hydrolase family protein [Chloroflexota bacterium]
AVVIGRYAKNVKAANAMDYVFGYAAFIDVSARGLGRTGMNSFIGKSFDTFAPIGPCIVTADEIPDPHKLHVQLWDDGQLRHDYNTDDMEHQIPALLEWATNVMGLNPGDFLACGTNHQGLGPMQDGERVEIEIERIGRFGVNVVDPLKRTWPKMVDVEAARRVREQQPLQPSH